MTAHEEMTEAGLNLIVYPSNLVGASRVGKIAKSLQASNLFIETHAVGMGIPSENLPEFELLAEGVQLRRVALHDLRSRIGWLVTQLLWPGQVVRRYAKQKVAVVSAQRALVLPLARRLARKTGAVFAYNAHELETEILGFTGIKQKIFKFIERKYIRHADVISVVNDSIADWYLQEYPGIVRPVVLTNTPIDDGNTVDLRAKLQIPEGELLYIHVGYISHGRNVPLILSAFAATPNAHVVFLGDGDLRGLVEEAAKVHQNIHWHPMVAPDSVVSYARGADVGLCLVEYASLSDELSTPNKLLESWVAGIPPLSSGLQEAKRLLGAQLTETWVLENPDAQLVDALARISKDDIAEFKRQWHQVPSWESQAIGLVDAYRAAIARKR